MADLEDIRGSALLLLRHMSAHEVRRFVDEFLNLISRSSDWLTEIAQTIFEEAVSSNLASVMCADLVYTLARSLERDHVEIQFTKAFLNSIQDELDPQGNRDAQLEVKADRRCASAQFLGRLFNRGLLGNMVITLAFKALLTRRSGRPPRENCIMGVCDLLHVVGHVCKVTPGSSLASRFDSALKRLNKLSRATRVDGSSVYSLQALDRMKEIMDFQMVGWPSEPKLVVQVQQIIHNDAAHVRATLLSGKTCMLLPGSLRDQKRLEDIRESIALHMEVHPCRLSVTQCCGNRNDVEGFASLPLTDSSVVRFLPVMDHKGKIILDLLEDTMYTTKTAVYYRRSASYCDKDLNIPALQAGVIVSGSLQTDNWIKVSVAT
eukprot:TRINITY_DN3245_c0_g1_i12.p1 TRINITY_DN3245_c0_g1~~TRINITY_DN3245_c0_g1_i12.p1  ORF type:complete len:377 (-),score=32.82 TRINITY_DN3245_c0_g1_i12:305-1435(-)